MAQIRSVGAGIRSKGNVDGLVYVHVKGKTYARALPIMPASMFQTPEALKRQALFTLIQWHLRAHSETIKHTFSRGECWSARNRYYKVNARALAEALDSLAESYANGGKVSVGNIESAIADYATSNPEAIIVGLLDGHQPVFLDGEWPSVITLSSLSGDGTVVVIEDRGVTTTYTPGEGSSVSGGSGSGSASQVTITTAASPANGGTVSGGGTVSKGSSVTLVATPASGFTFSKWQDNNTQATRTVTASASATYTATFVASGGGSGDGELELA